MTAHALRASAATNAWRSSIFALLVLMAILLGAYHETGAAMFAIWMRSETYAHALVVPPIVLWLVWRRRDELRQITPKPWPWALLPLAGAALLWLVGDLASANSAEQLGFTAMLVLAVPLVLGRQVAWALMFPLAFSFFAVPIGDFLTPILMEWTADFTVMALRISGVPVYREGLQFVIPSGKWSVVEACSGIRYLMASFMVGSLFAYLNYRSTRRRIVFMGVAILLPILANWVRAYMIVMLGHLSNNEIATGVDHLVYGWVFFGIVIMAMFFVGARWSEPDVTVGQGSSGNPLAGRAAAVSGPTAAAWSVLAVAVMVVLSPLFAVRSLDDRGLDQQVALSLPATLADGWQASEPPLSDWRPHFVGASTEFRQTYSNSAGRVAVHIAYYRNQSEAHKLVTSSNMLVRSDDYRWNPIRQGVQSIALPGRDLPVRTAELLATSAPNHVDRLRLKVVHYYWVGGHVTTSDVAAKLLSVWQRLSGQGDESAAVLVYSLDNTPAAMPEPLVGFMRSNIRTLDDSLQAARRSR